MPSLLRHPLRRYVRGRFPSSLIEPRMPSPSRRAAALVLLGASLLASAAAAPLAAQVTTLPTETPTRLQPTNYGFDYMRRDVMIPMRDGVKLHTVILVPKGASNAPMLMTRTPYDATATTTNSQSSHLASTLYGY